MGTWEYLVVEFFELKEKRTSLSISSDKHYHPRWINGKQKKNWENLPTFQSYIARLGLEGWEFTGNGPAERGGFNCIFKRPIQD